MKSQIEESFLPRPEHVALNVAEPLAMVEWYRNNLAMNVNRSGGPPTHTTFLTDVSGNIALELFSNTDFPMLDLRSIAPMSLHLAFITNDIAKTKADLLKAGAVVAEDISKAPSGDEFLMMRDPWGFSLQFIHRASPMISHIHHRPEHFAFNVRDSQAEADWLQRHLGMKVKRQGGAPTFGFFLADAGEHMMVELYQNSQHPMLDLPEVSYMSVHLAFSVADVPAAKQRLLTCGATVAEDVSTTPAGDSVLMMRDPWGMAIQFVKRVKPMVV